VSAQRGWQPSGDEEVLANERPHGSFSRQLFLGEGLDADRVEASYDNGVLTVTIPVVEQAKPRKVEITANDSKAKAVKTASAAT
jgi:HSP20 family protein